MQNFNEFSYVIAFLGGMLSFLSPCVLPLVPGYLSYVAGLRIEEAYETHRHIRYRLIFSSVLFVAGFGFVFMLLGAGASTLAPFLSLYQPIFTKIAACLIIVMGLHMMGIFHIKALYREWRHHPDIDEMRSIFTPLLLGIAFGLGWTPCIGPVLASILVLASNQETTAQGVALLGVYTLGLGIPFILVAVMMAQFQQKSKFLKKHLGLIEKLSGGLLVITGLLIFTANLQNIGAFLINMFPFLQKIG